AAVDLLDELIVEVLGVSRDVRKTRWARRRAEAGRHFLLQRAGLGIDEIDRAYAAGVVVARGDDHEPGTAEAARLGEHRPAEAVSHVGIGESPQILRGRCRLIDDARRPRDVERVIRLAALAQT